MKLGTSLFLITLGAGIVLWSQNQSSQTSKETPEMTQTSNVKYKKLYRSSDNRMIAGICGGLGEYFDVDPTIIRLIAAAGALMGFGIVAYLVAWIIIPLKPQQNLH